MEFIKSPHPVSLTMEEPSWLVWVGSVGWEVWGGIWSECGVQVYISRSSWTLYLRGKVLRGSGMTRLELSLNPTAQLCSGFTDAVKLLQTATVLIPGWRSLSEPSRLTPGKMAIGYRVRVLPADSKHREQTKSQLWTQNTKSFLPNWPYVSS